MNEQPEKDNERRSVIGGATDLTEATARRLIDSMNRAQRLAPVQRLRRYQIATAIIGVIGTALFIVGVERAAEDIPLISNAYGSIMVGVLLLAVTGTLFARLGGRGDD
jgi:hypothetical protein